MFKWNQMITKNSLGAKYLFARNRLLCLAQIIQIKKKKDKWLDITKCAHYEKLNLFDGAVKKIV